MEKHRARKRFGQNFLHDTAVIQQIVASIHPRSHDTLIEIGPGQGALTYPIIERLDQHSTLHLLEIDRDLAKILEAKIADLSNVNLHQTDALNFDFCSLANSNEHRLRVFGNLPYNISTPLIFHLLQQGASWQNQHQQTLIHDMYFMLQKEVVERLCAAPNSKTYGRLSVMAQYYCDAELLFTVPPAAFSPAPKVTSAIVRLMPHKTKPYAAVDETLFAKIVKSGFAQRRKTLRNTLASYADSALLESLGINPTARAETLALENFVAISNAVSNQQV